LKTLSIQALQQQRNLLRKKAHDSQSREDWKNFRNIRNEMKKTIKSAKSSFLRNALSSKRPKEVWDTINRILHPKTSKIEANPSVLNEHFNTTATRLLKCKEPPTQQLHEIINKFEDHPDYFNLRTATYSDVFKAIKRIRNDCSTGNDNIPSKYLKASIETITSPICHIINSCIENQLFPHQWKISRISPVPKVNKPTCHSDYRPISILPILSKVYERVILNQLVAYIEKNHLFAEYQSGFRKGHSTISTLLKLKDEILSAMKKGEVTLSIMADYSKAFDTVDYHTLIQKLHKIRIGKCTLRTLLSYLSDRKQFVQIHDQRSDYRKVTYGVPQGSILGPILFNIYVADMKDQASCPCLQYADDTSLLFHCKPQELPSCVEKVNNNLRNLMSWSTDNNLIFNSTKTKTILFSTSQMSRVHNLAGSTLTIKPQDEPIERVKSFKVLGITFTEHLKWNEHINRTIKNAFITLKSLKLIQRFTPYHVRKNLAEALVISKLDYGNVLLANVPAYLMKRMQRVQNMAASYVTKRFMTENDVINLNWLPVRERIEYAVCKMGYKAINDPNWPNYLKLKTYQQSRRYLRSNQNNSNSIEWRKNVDSSFEQVTSNAFNDLPPPCRKAENYHLFCNLSKNYFVDKILARLSRI